MTVEGVVLLMVLPLVYMCPWLVAVGRDHHHRSAIAVLNLLLGWTFVDWVVALVWALTVTPRPGK
jgi:ABC-type transport system involved in cytochrome c biogenesis permease component